MEKSRFLYAGFYCIQKLKDIKTFYFFLGGIDILIEETIYPNYANLTNQTIDVGGNLSFSKPEANCVEVYFPSTTSVQFCERREMLSFVVTLSEDYRNSTRGLLGTWNDDPSDDFTLPNGTVLPPSSTSRKIHFDFGVKCEFLVTYMKKRCRLKSINPTRWDVMDLWVELYYHCKFKVLSGKVYII